MDNQFFNCNLRGEPEKVDSKDALNKIFQKYPDGDDWVGNCICEKLKKLRKGTAKQYLVCISDGTAHIGDHETQRKYLQMAKEKNIELKLVIFSDGIEEGIFPREDIFYIFRD
jgi:hypothetical protein